MAKEPVEGLNNDINAAKLKALQATIDKIEKDFGKGTIMKLGDQPQWDVQVIPSGSVALDHALGISERKDHRDLRARVQRQDDACHSRYS